ncbi:MAG: hypothetical protein ACJ779_05305 [Chloroflexota bacterium]
MDDPLSPLARKLKLKPGMRAAVIGAPPDYVAKLGVPGDTAIGTTLDGPLDWIQVFVRTTADLAAIAGPLTAALAPDGRAWVCYPKGSSKMQTDLTRDKGWEPLEAGQLMWLSLVSVDEIWSAFGLRPYRRGEARQTFR